MSTLVARRIACLSHPESTARAAPIARTRRFVPLTEIASAMGNISLSSLVVAA
jgi:hypothetical protein